MVLRILALVFAWVGLAACSSGTLSAHAQDTSKLRQEAQAGDAKAQYELAGALMQGEGVDRDTVTGMRWLQKSANQGYSQAERALAVFYQNGRGGVPRDEGKAFELYRRAAKHGDAKAQSVLGTAYRYGKSGVDRDFREAARWFRKAARQGNEEAKTSLFEMLSAGSISKAETDWHRAEPLPEGGSSKSKALSLADVEKGLQGGITNKRMATLVKEYGVDFALNEDTKQRLRNEGADENLLSAISGAKRLF